MSSLLTLSSSSLEVERAVESGAPLTEMEQLIASVWQQVLQVQDVAADDNFFDLGGHSLALVSVYEQLRQMVSAEFTVMEMFEHPSVRRLARHLSAQQAGGAEVESDAGVQERARKQKEARRQQHRLMKGRENHG